jgi:hypothetical protein
MVTDMQNGPDASGFPPGTSAIVQETVMDRRMPALVVIHDDEDDWLVGDGVNDPNVRGASGIYHIDHVVALDPSIGEVAAMPTAHWATRPSASDPWTISQFSYEDRDHR